MEPQARVCTDVEANLVEKKILHFYSGPNVKFWEKELGTRDTEVLCVDVLANCKADVLDDKIYKYLLMLASTGKVREVLGVLLAEVSVLSGFKTMVGLVLSKLKLTLTGLLESRRRNKLW